jgi:hypothetical protein
LPNHEVAPSDTYVGPTFSSANHPTIDRGEPTSEMEPLLLSEGSRHRGFLNDLAVELAATSA